MTAPHIPPDNHKVAVTCGRSLGGQGVGIEKFCESGRCEEQAELKTRIGIPAGNA